MRENCSSHLSDRYFCASVNQITQKRRRQWKSSPKFIRKKKTWLRDTCSVSFSIPPGLFCKIKHLLVLTCKAFSYHAAVSAGALNSLCYIDPIVGHTHTHTHTQTHTPFFYLIYPAPLITSNSRLLPTFDAPSCHAAVTAGASQEPTECSTASGLARPVRCAGCAVCAAGGVEALIPAGTLAARESCWEGTNMEVLRLLGLLKMEVLSWDLSLSTVPGMYCACCACCVCCCPA
jgi:hypothetical protein